jgi:hypothetical protein
MQEAGVERFGDRVMFHRSACPAATRSTAAERPAMRIGGYGSWTGFGLPNAPVRSMWAPWKSNGSVSVHSRRMTVQASARSSTECLKS